MTFARVRAGVGAGLISAVLLTGTGAAAQEAATAHVEPVFLEAPPEANQTVVNFALGATGNSGNTEAISGNAGGSLEIKRFPHMFSLDVLGTMGYAKASTTVVDAMGDSTVTEDFDRNAANGVGRARYDYFLTPDDALFVALQPRRDIFAGIDARLQWQAGYLRNLFFPSDDNRLWTELGFDITQDWYRIPEGQPTVDEMGARITPTPDDTFYSARAFLGYTNRLSAVADFSAGFEFLYDVQEPSNYRFNARADLNTTLTDRFKLGVGFMVMYDHVPVEGAQRADTISTLQAVYTFDSLADAPAAPECPVCGETSPEAASTSELGESGEVTPLDPAAAAAEAAPAIDVDTATPAEVQDNAPAAPVAQPGEAVPAAPAAPTEAAPVTPAAPAAPAEAAPTPAPAPTEE